MIPAWHRLKVEIAVAFVDEQVPPYISNVYPLPNSRRYQIGQPMLFYMRDDGAGIDPATFWAKIKGTIYKYQIDEEVSLIYATPSKQYCVFGVQAADLYWNEDLAVEVYCEDRLGNPGLIEEIE